ncbi:G-box-binding factor 1 [Quillaja saponaria]|uniref:G-box-binding factor 1 n=1 Tax=Quillaja saponaria TaxID=32244 RepID=A0AAD7M083_QUISA|nr:G-box-binding factor 1 [Quillaja saponaria]
MGTDEFNANETRKPSKKYGAQDVNLNAPSQQWPTPMQASYNSEPFHYAAAPYFYAYMTGNQAYGASQHYNSPNAFRLFNAHPDVSKVTSVTSPEKEERIPHEKDIDSVKKRVGTLEPTVFENIQSREIGSGSSVSRDDEIVAQRPVSVQNVDVIHVKRESGLHDVTARRNEMNLNSGMNLNKSGAKRILKKVESEMKTERRKVSNRESAKRSRQRRVEEYDKLEAAMNDLKNEGSMLKKKLVRLSQDCLELSNENNSIEANLISRHGQESISDILAWKPAS